jgi:riboflavin synthase
MFSGLICDIGRVLACSPNPTGLELVLAVPASLAQGLSLGASVSINGVCLTLVKLEIGEAESSLYFDVIQESLSRSNLSSLKVNSVVNVERSLKMGEEIGGHLCSGHVDGQIEALSVIPVGEGRKIEFSCPEKFEKYIFEKGYVALNGASITVAKKSAASFVVALIPETLKRTNLGSLVVGDKVNLEIDRQTQAIVDSVERVMKLR